MDGLFALAIFLPLTLLVLLIVVTIRLAGISRELGLTRERINTLLSRLDPADPPTGPSVHVAEEEPVEPPPPPDPTPHIPDPFPSETEPEPAPEEEISLERLRELFPDTSAEHQSPRARVEAPSAKPSESTYTPPPKQPRGPSFFERNPDLEKFIGENLINKIGIAVLVFGIGFLLKYAIGRDMISEAGRTLVGLVAGGILVVLAHRMRERFRAFSSVLVAGGIAVFYFTVAIAFHEYHLIGQTAAFLSMVGITGLAVAFTLGYDRRELAVIALLGGFASPFMASTGEGNFRVLFTYLLILNVGMLVLANFKKWPILNILSFGLSWLIFGAWAVASYSRLDPPPMALALCFAAGFYLVFGAMILLYDLRHRTPFDPLDYSMYLLNNALFLGAGLLFLEDSSVRVGGLFALVIAGFNLLLALRFFRDARVPRNLVFLLIGLVLTFLSLAAPIQLDGSHITLFWAAEAVLLLWFGQRSGLRLVEKGSILVLGAMLGSLLIDLADIYQADTLLLSPLLNKGWITGIVASVSLFLYGRLLRNEPLERTILAEFTVRHLRNATEVFFVLVLFATNYLELQAQSAKVFSVYGVQLVLLAYSLLFLLLLDLAVRKRSLLTKGAVGVLLAARLLAQISLFYAASRGLLAEHLHYDAGNHFILLHYATLALAVFAVVRVAQLARELLPRPSFAWSAYLWGMCILLVVLGSQELDHLLVLGGRHDGASIGQVLQASRKWGYPILWGIGSFLFMLYGMKMRLRTVRVIALALFGITLVKLFLFDIVGVSEGGKVAAFISLGILLLVVSFLYQKLKGLLIDGPEATRPGPDA